jgi:hypothetical protein
MRRFFFIAPIVSALAILPVVAVAQWTNQGNLGQWTSASVSRINEQRDDMLLTSIRVAKNNGFDRLVFEFKGGIPNYLIQFERGPAFENTAERKIRVRGRYFITINLQTLPYPEDDSKDADIKLPTRTGGMKLFNQMKEIEWFEGVRFFAIGLDAKRPFRVTELKNPNRLVIDFRY